MVGGRDEGHSNRCQPLVIATSFILREEVLGIAGYARDLFHDEYAQNHAHEVQSKHTNQEWRYCKHHEFHELVFCDPIFDTAHAPGVINVIFVNCIDEDIDSTGVQRYR